jgi:Major Facilitator Superfamily
MAEPTSAPREAQRTTPWSAADGLPIPQRWWAMVTVRLAITMSVLDSSIANIALPTIAGDMAASPTTAIWIVNAYQLAITITLLPLASLGDIHEYRRVYRVGLAVFTLASLGCALSHTFVELPSRGLYRGLAPRAFSAPTPHWCALSIRAVGSVRRSRSMPSPYRSPQSDRPSPSFRSDHGNGCSRSMYHSASSHC